MHHRRPKTEFVAPAPLPVPDIPAAGLGPTAEQIASFREIALARTHRSWPRLLIVEDQAFSRSLLLQALSRSYSVHAATDAETAMKLYLEYAPDIVFLDIELQGALNGHHIAKAINTFDPQAFIVMVTASNHSSDVVQARQNGAQGFIVKPYSKKKILDSIEKFTRQKNKVGQL